MTSRSAGRSISTETYYVPAITALAVISATLVNLAIDLTRTRDAGDLKRVRGTPVPTWVVFAGRIGNSIVLSLLMLAVVTTIGALLYNVDVPWSHLPAILRPWSWAPPPSRPGDRPDQLDPFRRGGAGGDQLLSPAPLFPLGDLRSPDEIPEGVLTFAGFFRSVTCSLPCSLRMTQASVAGSEIGASGDRGRLGPRGPAARDSLLPLDPPNA